MLREENAWEKRAFRGLTRKSGRGDFQGGDERRLGRKRRKSDREQRLKTE